MKELSTSRKQEGTPRVYRGGGGGVKAQWDPVAGSKTYEVQTSPDPFTATSWSRTKSVTKSMAVLAGFTSGARIWVRVRAIGSGGEGNYSSEISKIVP